MGKVVFNCFLLTFISCAVIGYDITSHGSLESSRTGRYLKDAGLLIYIKPYYSVIEENTISLYKWGKKNFPYKEYGTFKNKTIDITTNVGNKVIYWTKEGISTTEKYRLVAKNWIIKTTKSEFWQNVFKFSEKVGNSILDLCATIVNYSIKIWKNYLAWLKENVSRDKFTWENFKISYFIMVEQIKVYYSNIAIWIGRKLDCLVSA